MPRPHQTYKMIKSFEAKELKKRNFISKFTDTFSNFFGTITFLILNLLFFAAWLIINTGNTPLPIIDPAPFVMLTTMVSLEAIFLTIIVLISQNKQSYISTLREELHLQVNLIAEKEITKILKLLTSLHKHHKIVITDPELEDMIKDLDASYIERQLAQQLTAPKTTSTTMKMVNTVTQPLMQATEEVARNFTSESK